MRNFTKYPGDTSLWTIEHLKLTEEQVQWRRDQFHVWNKERLNRQKDFCKELTELSNKYGLGLGQTEVYEMDNDRLISYSTFDDHSTYLSGKLYKIKEEE